MGRYTAGLQGFNKDGVPNRSFQYTQTCRPNKTWDYLAAGIPTIGVNPGNTARIYEGKWGIVARGLSKESLIDLHKSLPEIDEATRRENVIEADTDKFKAIIETVLMNDPLALRKNQLKRQGHRRSR
jgi:hypothetical protein